jgi:Flp pilus assembly protein TadG
MTRLTNSFRRFLRDESGVLLAEALILLPMLIWAMLSLFVYWDVFRTINVNQKATYSIADLLSRQGLVSTDYVDGMQDILAFLTAGNPRTSMRITSLEYDSEEDEYLLLFSRSPSGDMTPYTEETIQDLRPLIPIMSNLDSVIIVETELDYIPRFDTGVLNMAGTLGGQTFTQFIVTRPRFSRRVCMTACPDGAPPSG